MTRWRLFFAYSYSVGFLLWLVLAPLGMVRPGGFATIAVTARRHADDAYPEFAGGAR